MGNSWEDGPSRPRKPRKPKESSQRPTGRTVGMAWLLLAFPTTTVLVVVAYLLHGYGAI